MGLLTKVRAEGHRILNSPASDLLKTLTSEGGKAPPRLTARQLDFARRLDALTREILKESLLRGLDAKLPPPAKELEARLSEDAKRQRQGLVAHVDAIALDGILSPAQARPLRRKLSQKTVAAPGSRYGPYRTTGCKPVEKLDQLQLEIEQEQRVLEHGQVSFLFASLAAQGLAQAKIDPVQIDLAKKLDRLSREILFAWLSRTFARANFPETDWDAAASFDAWNRQSTNFVARAEVLLLRGILSPDQVEPVLMSFWKSMGHLALWDPQVADRLKLTKDQRCSCRSNSRSVSPCRRKRPASWHCLGRKKKTGSVGRWGRLLWNINNACDRRRIGRSCEFLPDPSSTNWTRSWAASRQSPKPPTGERPAARIVPKRSTPQG